jgi:hypothetical protein
MGVGRLAPHRVRAKYAKALAEIPLPVRSFNGIDASALRVLAEVEIAGRRVEFGVLAGTPRLWITLPEGVPQVLGYLTGLDSAASAGALQLHITETDHLEWARHTGRSARIKTEALAAWLAAQRECEG